MKVIIAGSRNFNNYQLLADLMDIFIRSVIDIEIVSGTASGADKLGERYAKERGYKLKRFPADWDNYGKSAGYKRNLEMGEYADMLVAFWDGESKGTKHMIDIALSKNLDVYIVNYITKKVSKTI